MTDKIEKNSRTGAIVTAIGALAMIVAFILFIVQDRKKQEIIVSSHDSVKVVTNQLKEQDSLNKELTRTQLESFGYKIESDADFHLRQQADAAIKKLKSSPDFTITKKLKIQYFIKTFDEDKIWVAINELGYNEYQKTESRVKYARTNGIFYHGREATLNDVKLIALTLIRCGCKIQRIAPQFKFNNTIQVFGKDIPNAEPLTAEKIMSATKLEDLNTGAPSGEKDVNG